MKKLLLFSFLLIIAMLPAGDLDKNYRLPEDIIPELGCWFWQEPEFEPQGYKTFIDLVAEHAPYKILTTSIRFPDKELTDEDLHKRIKSAAQYAESKNISIVMDLDVRLARQAFYKKYPHEMQQMVILKEIDLSSNESTDAVIHSFDLSDHYTFRTTHYIPLSGSFLRAYSYSLTSGIISPASLKDITKECIVLSQNKDSVYVRIKINKIPAGRKVCLMVSFTHLTPDVFAPHLIEFQRNLIKKYADVPLAGAAKDEWGFPPNFDGNPEKNQYWYSKWRAEKYKEITKGRDLLSDFLLMYRGIKGYEQQRILAVNYFMRMSRQRNAALEDDFHRTVKEVFGRKALSATHPTWWPYPDSREFKKNGLDWWQATRSYAQTDELTPYCVRTALSKKWNSPVWFNMFYSKDKKDYEKAVWQAALSGGRINYHRPWPSKDLHQARTELLRGKLMRAECRVRLLNFITKSPLDCPVAVVFGHAAAMNWAGNYYNDSGVNLANMFWKEGYPADLIPDSEIENNSLHIDENGWICYGKQRYSAVILYHPQYGSPQTAEFFKKAAKGRTLLCYTGGWTRDFNGRLFDSAHTLPQSMTNFSKLDSLAMYVISKLQKQNIPKQTAAADSLKDFGHISAAPQTSGFARLIDGTIIQIAADKNVTGDAITNTIKINGYPVSFKAQGLAAVRLDKSGKVTALAAGGLTYFKRGNYIINLKKPTDLALWKNGNRDWLGVIQDWKGAVPDNLLKLTKNWLKIYTPPAL